MNEMKSVGQTAYEAYCEAVGWKSFTGVSLPEWQDQRHSLRQAWERAAEAVLDKASNFPKRRNAE